MAANITYAIVDANGLIQVQGYSTEEEFPLLTAEEGFFIVQTPRMLNKAKKYFTTPGVQGGEWADIQLTENPLDSLVEVDDNGAISLSVPAGFIAITEDNVSHTEVSGSVTITFPRAGLQYVRVQENGKAYVSRQVDVVFLAHIKEKMKAEVDAARNLKLYEPIEVNGVTLDGDPTAQRNIVEAATLGAFEVLRGNITFSVDWITADNQFISLNASELEAFAQAIGARRETEYAAARVAKNQILAAGDRATAAAYRDAYIQS